LNSAAENRIRIGRLQAEFGTRNHAGGGRIKHMRRSRPEPSPSGRRARQHRELIVLGGSLVA
jgi:hypothetical protein